MVPLDPPGVAERAGLAPAGDPPAIRCSALNVCGPATPSTVIRACR